MIRLLFFVSVIIIIPHSVLSQSKICSKMTIRAISINEEIFEVKDNILGKFYLNPNILESNVVGDTIFFKGMVSHIQIPKGDVQIFICSKAKRTFREKIAKIELYKIVRYGGVSDSYGQFDLSFNYRNEILLFRDYSSGLDSFLFLEVKPICN